MIDAKTILVMDDEPEYVEMMRHFLEEEGYHVLTAHDGESGLKVIHNMRPDLVIMDVNMPHMSGLQFYREISTPHGRTKLPVLVITARAELESFFKELEVEGFLVKPFAIPALLNEIETIFNKKKERTVFLVGRKELPNTVEIAAALLRERYRVVYAEDPVALEREVVAGSWPDFVAMEYVGGDQENRNYIPEIKKILSRKTDEGSPSPKVPIIVYTYSDQDYKEKSLADGADKYIGRPGNYDPLIVAIREIEIEEKEKNN